MDKELVGWIDLHRDNISDFQVDSRRIGPKSLFFALPGAKVHGHRFLNQVAKQGGFGAVIEKGYEGDLFGLKIFEVDDVLQSLQSLAQQLLASRSSKVLGITGSLGKTTTKEFAATILSEQFSVAKTYANYNTQIGLPLTILNAKGNEDLTVLEMAMTEKGHIKRLTEIAPPDIAVITKVDWVHAENFTDGIEGIKSAKAEIFSSPKTKVKILPYELSNLVDGPKITFSICNQQADFFLSQTNGKYYVDERGIRVACVEFPFLEKQFIEDAFIAMVLARQCNMSFDTIAQGVMKLIPPKMRFEKLELLGATFINDTYNAGPLAICTAMDNLPPAQKGRRCIAVLGEMSHLGKFSEKVHTDVAKHALEKVDEVICIGERATPICNVFSEAKKPASLYKSLHQASQKLRKVIMPGDVVLVKGSRHLNLENIFELLS